MVLPAPVGAFNMKRRCCLTIVGKSSIIFVANFLELPRLSHFNLLKNRGIFFKRGPFLFTHLYKLTIRALGLLVMIKSDHYCDIKTLSFFQVFIDGGGGGIRTHGTYGRTTVFETAPFDHSGTPPSKSNKSLFTSKRRIRQYPIYI